MRRAREAFVRMLQSLRRWDSWRKFSPWLLAIAGNRCRTALAARKHPPALAIAGGTACGTRLPAR